MRNVSALGAITTIGLAFVLPMNSSLAQEKQRVAFKASAANTKYTQQHAIEVGDLPGHQIRIFEIHRTYPDNPPVINGTKLVGSWSRVFSDYMDANGVNPGYNIYVLENGDKFFSRYTCVATNNGEGTLNTACTAQITGGTGKLANMRGVLRSTNVSNPKAGFNENQTEIEYYLEK